jgi:cytochrome c-type biogenesis protein CcmH/NrfG
VFLCAISIQRSRFRPGKIPVFWALAIGLALPWAPLFAADPADGFAQLRKGSIQEALAAAEAGLSGEGDKGEWHRLKIEALLASGRYDDAREAVKPALEVESRSLVLLWTAREALRMGGKPADAADFPDKIERLMSTRDYAYRDAPSIVVYGQALLLRGVDPKKVLEGVFSVAQKIKPSAREPYLARGMLALEKGDGALAAKAFREGLKASPDDPDLHYGLARAFYGSDREQTGLSLEKALELNAHHIPGLLLKADLLIDREDYATASTLLDKIAEVNPARPEMWALRAVIAHLRNDKAGESAARAAALKTWPGNPEPDHLLGRKLSQKYRFAEGAAAQKRALAADPGYLPAKAQLASDMLRLGDEAEGWKLAEAVNDADAYNVSVHNLLNLHDMMQSKFATLQNGDFTVRMDKNEAAIYGPRVLELLGEARKKLGEKYGVDVRRPTVVEIFPSQKDFGVRTFGMPDNPGYLGVCFGRVVTANSPAANTHPVNWESVLWHEFCHTVTLQATANRMPRWLSEGISVYEERQADPSWGEQMSPRYRTMIQGEDLTQVGKLSGAFLAPKTAAHLMFAYYESSLVVEFIVGRYGAGALKRVLADLAEGITINDALAKRTAPMEELERDFKAFAVAKAGAFAPKMDWTKPEPELLLPGNEGKLHEWAAARPTNYWMLMREAVHLMDEKKWPEAAVALKHLLELNPDERGSDGPLGLLAKVHQETGDTAAEYAELLKLAQIDSAIPDVNARLVTLATAAKDWKTAAAQARRWLAVNPLVAPPWRALAQASEETGDWTTAATAWRTILALDPPDPAGVHFNLARVLQRSGDKAALRHVLMALEDNPRHREALRLLLEIDKALPATTPAPVPSTPPQNP